MAQSTYADLEIRILNKIGDGYPVELTLNNEQEFSGGRLDPGGLPWLPTADSVADGQRLFAWLFADAKLKAAWVESRGRYGQRRLRLRIDAEAPELHAIPWELLREPVEGAMPADLAAAVATPFSRYLAGRWQPGSPILQRPLRVLVAIAGPTDLAERGLQAIDVAEELATLQAALATVEVKLVELPQPCTLAAIEAALKERIHILHFIGHGHYNEEKKSAALMLANDKNEVQPVTDKDIAEMLARQLADSAVQNDNKLRLVFLSSCQTAVRSPADAFRGLAPQLVQAGVPAVVAMQDLVPIKTAHAFTATFYRQLLQHGQVDLAANEARSRLLTAKLPGASIPVLFMRLREGLLLGKRGRIGGDKRENFWPSLLTDLREGKCVPFLGPRITAGLLPDAGEVATKLAEKFNYPMADTHDLAKVARYVAQISRQDLRTEYTRILRRSLFAYLSLKPTKEDRERYAEANFTMTAKGIGWAEKVLIHHENEIHHLLADLRLPLYMTTNSDCFMTEALRARGLTTVRRAGPRWEQVQAGRPQYTFHPEPEPSRANPVVFHLNGYDDDQYQASQLVLSEDDFLRHFVRLHRDHNYVLPAEVVELLGKSSFLFLGYSLDDWEFRVVLQGLVAALKQEKVRVGVQLEEGAGQATEKVIEHLGDYMLRQHKIQIYWGTPQQFVTELHAEWQKLSGQNGATEGGTWNDDDW